MENIIESLPPSWIVTTTVKTVGKKSGEGTAYFNEKTWQTFYTREDLDRYVKYVKKELPEVYTDWMTPDSKKKCVNKRRSKKKEVAGTSKCISNMPKQGSDTAPDALAKEQLLENGPKADIVYTRKRKMAVAEATEIPVSSPPKAEPKDYVFDENLDLYQASEMGVGIFNGALYIDVDSDSNALMDQIWEECDKMPGF